MNRITLDDIPHFTIDQILSTRDDVEGCLTGQFSDMRGVRNDAGWLYRSDRPSVVGRLEPLPKARGEAVRFFSPDPEYVAELRVGDSYPWVDIYWQAYHVTMILAGRWEPRTFVATPARYFRLNGLTGWQQDGYPLPEGAEDLGVREAGWDHEHCELCSAHIGGLGDPYAFVDPDDHWLCRSCHDRHAVPRDLSFLVE